MLSVSFFVDVRVPHGTIDLTTLILIFLDNGLGLNSGTDEKQHILLPLLINGRFPRGYSSIRSRLLRDIQNTVSNFFRYILHFGYIVYNTIKYSVLSSLTFKPTLFPISSRLIAVFLVSYISISCLVHHSYVVHAYMRDKRFSPFVKPTGIVLYFPYSWSESKNDTSPWLKPTSTGKSSEFF